MEFISTALLLPFVLFAAAPLFIYLYAILRWRAGGSHEPGLGSFSLVLYFRTVALLLAVGAVSLLFYLLMSKEENAEMARTCWGLLAAAGLFLVLHLPVGRMLRPVGDCQPATRIFGGGLMGIAGMVVFVSLILFLVTLFEEMPEGASTHRAERHADQLKMFGAWLVCFGGLYFGTVMAMSGGIRRSGSVN